MLISGMQLRHSLTPRYFAGVFNKLKPTKKDLDHYDFVIIGCNLGGVISRQLDKVSHGKYKTMVVLDQNINQITPFRQIYEQQKTKDRFLIKCQIVAQYAQFIMQQQQKYNGVGIYDLLQN